MLPGADDIEPETHTPSSTAEIQIDLGDNVVDGQIIYTTVTCFNGVGLSATHSSNGVIIVTQPPNAEFASVTIKSSGITQYPPREFYQSDTSRIKAYWTGFIDPLGIVLYEVRIVSFNNFKKIRQQYSNSNCFKTKNAIKQKCTYGAFRMSTCVEEFVCHKISVYNFTWR